ncbi:MAG: hypothetical protein IJL21_00530 [Alphaproteobacteria bacterium]|nr:hypothetical protein [Alphaproteobacteria bacterium]
MKLLICYDIAESDEEKRNNIETTLMSEKNATDWVRQNKSGWVILTDKSTDSWQNYFDLNLTDKNSKYEIISITNIDIKYKGYDNKKNEDSLKIMTASY